MRKVILIGIILLTGFLIFGYFRVRSDLLEDKQSINEQTSTQQAQKNNPSIDTRESIFVPYWSVNDLNSEKLVQYEKVIYFGVSAKGEGIDRNGWKNHRGIQWKNNAAVRLLHQQRKRICVRAG